MRFLKRIHKETPMFSMLFQLFLGNTLGILKGFQTENTENTGITTDSGQDKIALQGAGFHQRVTKSSVLNNTVFLVFRIFQLLSMYAARRVCSVRELSRRVFSEVNNSVLLVIIPVVSSYPCQGA